MSAEKGIDREIRVMTAAYRQAIEIKQIYMRRAADRSELITRRRKYLREAGKWRREEFKYLDKLKELEAKRLEGLRLQSLERQYHRRRRRMNVRDHYDGDAALWYAAIGYAMAARNTMMATTTTTTTMASLPLLEHKAVQLAWQHGVAVQRRVKTTTNTAQKRCRMADALVHYTLSHAAGDYRATAAHAALEALGPHWKQYHRSVMAAAAMPTAATARTKIGDDLDFLSHAIVMSAAAAAKACR